MEKGRGLLRDMIQAADMPGEMLSGTPLIELTGSGRIFLENHQGITEYTTERIGIRVANGIVTVVGRNLTIARMTANQMVITGRISMVELQGRCCK